MATIGKYQLAEQIGQGGMGSVYRSYHPHLGRTVAVKLMRDSTSDPDARQRFMREAQLVAGLSHPNIINIFDVDIAGDTPLLAMELLEGGSLAQRVGAHPLPLAEVLAISIPLAEALEYAHRAGVVHRDLKPSNVLLRQDGTPVLADFGLAKPITGTKLTQTGALVGTIAYMAPEQISSGPIDARTDIYALGVLLFELLSGRLPFEGDSGQMLVGHVQRQPPPLRSLNPALPVALERLVAQMLAKNPADRPASAAEVAAALRSVQPAATGATVALSTPTAALPGTAPGQPASTIGVVVAALSILLVIAILIGWLGSTRRESAVATPTRLAANSDTAATRDPEPPATPAPTAVVALPSADPATAPLPTGLPMPTLAPTAAVQGGPAPSPAIAIGPEGARELAVLDAPLLSAPISTGPEPFSVGGLSFARVGQAYYLYGEVRNDGPGARESIRVRITLFDAQAQELISDAGFAARSYLAPGEVAPFLVLFVGEDLPAPATISGYGVEVTSSVADFQPDYTLRGLVVDDGVKARRGSLSGWEIGGFVVNEAGEAVNYPQIHAVFYDSAGRVVGLANSFAETAGGNALAAGQRARFQIQAFVFTGQPASYRLYAEGSQVR